MNEPVYTYDEDGDILYVAFAPGEKGTGIELNDQILLRLNKSEHRAIGLTLFDYSVLVQPTELGPRSFPLTGLSELSDELRQLVLEVISGPPVNEILTLSVYTPSLAETIPIASLHTQHILGTPLASVA
ncbi:MAG: DUF2283 domain-containing protein [Dehalococcoidia bacterium]